MICTVMSAFTPEVEVMTLRPASVGALTSGTVVWSGSGERKVT